MSLLCRLALLRCLQKAAQLLIMRENIIKKRRNSDHRLYGAELQNYTDLLLFSLCAFSFLFIYLLLTNVMPKFWHVLAV